MATITSANAVFLLSVASVVTTPQQLQGFGTDDAFLTNVVEAGEVQVGVDGYGVGGWIPRSPTQTIRFLASSIASLSIFENWIGAMDQLQDTLYASGSISFPSLGRKYTMYQGQLMRVSTMADAKKVLQNREFEITWLPQGPIPAISFAPM